MGAVHKGGDGGGRLTFSASAGAPQWLRSTDIYESAEVRTPEVSQGRAGWYLRNSPVSQRFRLQSSKTKHRRVKTGNKECEEGERESESEEELSESSSGGKASLLCEASFSHKSRQPSAVDPA